MSIRDKRVLAYIIGIALGDGNLSNPNGRATRLRITCDTRYILLIQNIVAGLKRLLPMNKVSIIRVPKRNTYLNISVYSNRLNTWMPWQVGKGPKESQKAHVPRWIMRNKTYTKECLRGLLQTDGSIYKDRGYLMVNFTNHTSLLAKDVYRMLQTVGFRPTLATTPSKNGGLKYTVRVVRDSKKLLHHIRLFKA